jgi:pyruvate dehydrogenase E1 component alpha subunit
VRQNNQYAESTPKSDYQGIPDIVAWASSYGLPAIGVDGNNVLEVYEAAKTAVDRARHGEGPSFIESVTYRWYGHNIGDPGTWRPKEEIEEWKAKDPIPRFRKLIIQQNIAMEIELNTIEGEEEEELRKAIAAAEEAPKPELRAALEDVYLDPVLGAKATQGARP